MSKRHVPYRRAHLRLAELDKKAAAEFAAKVEEVKNAPTVDKIEQLIKDHDALSDAAKDKLPDQTKTDYEKLVDDLGDCGNPNNTSTGGHDYETHRKAIEEAGTTLILPIAISTVLTKA